jgi:hypothetical protein
VPAIVVALATPLGMLASPVEVVVAHLNENLGWLDHLASTEKPHISIYTQGAEPAEGLDAEVEVHQLPNVGREVHSFLSHMANGYEKLANWTVFTQAGEASFGHRGHKEGGGHLMAGDSFVNYLVPDANSARLVHTSATHLPSMNHLLRAAYCSYNEQLGNSAITECPDEASKWTSWWDMGPFREFIQSKIDSRPGECALCSFQGKILGRPKKGHEHAPAALAGDVDSSAGSG